MKALAAIRRWFGIRTANDDLLNLMLVARTDPQIGRQLKTILRQPDAERQSLLRTWIAELPPGKAPESLARALTALLDDDRAHRALSILEQGEIV
jgi:hypothetical protein